MTRWARAGDSNKKKHHEGTKWNEMFENNKTEQHGDGSLSGVNEKKKKKNKAFKKDKQFKKLKGVSKKDKSESAHVAKPWTVGSSSGDKVDKAKERALRNQYFKDKRSEERRKKRKQTRDQNLECFNCRRKGHRLEECPEVRGSTKQGTGICFKCGSTEHKASACSAKVSPGDFPYAKCFICGETGHITRQCPDNPRGLYPKGGCCKECGSVEHLRKDCPEVQKKEDTSNVTVMKLSDTQSADAEIDQSQEVLKRKKKGAAKIVKF